MREEFEGMDTYDIADIIFHETYITSKAQLFDALGRYLKKAKSKKGLPIFITTKTELIKRMMR